MRYSMANLNKPILLLLLCASLSAQETFTLEEQTVTASHITQDELSYAAPIEIYTDQDIQSSKSKNIYDFLNQETSVITSQAYGSPFSQRIDMRGYGIENGYENIVIVVNGRRMNNIDNVPQLLASIPIDSIEKIEILKGSGSVEYGDGANAGVINIKTKEYHGANIKTYAGNFGTLYGSLGAGYQDELFSLSAFGNYYESDGQRDLYLEGRDSSRLKNGSFDLKLFPTEALELRVGFAATRSKVNYAGKLTQEQYEEDPSQATLGLGSDSLQYYDTDVWTLGLSYVFNQKWSMDANVNLEDKASDYQSFFYDNKLDYSYNSGDITTNYETQELKLSFGLSLFDGLRDSVANANSTTKENIAAFIKANYTHDKHTLMTGLRAEKASYSFKPSSSTAIKDDDTLYAYELGYNYTINEVSSIYTNFAHSFQTPNIDRFFIPVYDAFWNQIGATFNGFLKPMKTNTYNIGYNHFSKMNKLKVSAFYADIKDEIYFNPITYQNTNLDETSKLGFEVYDKYLLQENLYISANYTYVEATIDKDDSQSLENKTLPGVSKHNLVTSIGYAPTQESKVIASHTYRSSAYALNDFQNSFTQKQEAYNSTDLSLSYTLNGNIEVFAKIQNLLDEDNAIWIADDTIYPSNFQRSYYAGLNATF